VEVFTRNFGIFMLVMLCDSILPFYSFWFYLRREMIKRMYNNKLCSENSVKASDLKQKRFEDSNPDFPINPKSDVRRIAPKMLWVHYLVGVSHFAECHENRLVTV